jgi:hypothetical protein
MQIDLNCDMVHLRPLVNREIIVTTLNIFFVFVNHLKMAAKRGRKM